VSLLDPDGSRQPSLGAFPTFGRTLRVKFITRSWPKYQPDSRRRQPQGSWVTWASLRRDPSVLTLAEAAEARLGAPCGPKTFKRDTAPTRGLRRRNRQSVLRPLADRAVRTTNRSKDGTA
jgi:hypothetical protein